MQIGYISNELFHQKSKYKFFKQHIPMYAIWKPYILKSIIFTASQHNNMESYMHLIAQYI